MDDTEAPSPVTDPGEEMSDSDKLTRDHAAKRLAFGKVAFGIAHRLQNSLSAIRLSAEMAQYNVGVSTKSAAEVIEEVDAVSPLVSDLMSLGRGTNSEMRLIDLNLFFKNKYAALSDCLGSKNELALELHERFAWCYIDPLLFSSIVDHLVRNASEAMIEAGKVTIHVAKLSVDEVDVSRSPLPEHGEYLCVSIRDTGIGIREENLDKVFEPFFTTRLGDNHAGLGLTVAYALVDQILGWLDIETVYREGTTVKIYLPYFEEEPTPEQLGRGGELSPVLVVDGKAEVATDGEEAFGASASGDATASGGECAIGAGAGVKPADAVFRKRVILVEDERLLRETCKDFLELADFEVLECGSGEEAIRLWHEIDGACDCVVTDVMMPRMSGVEMAAHFRQYNRHCKIIFTSALPRAACEQNYGLRLTDKFLPKPYTFDQLKNILE